MTETGACSAYTSCTHFVHTAGAAFLLLAMPASAQIEDTFAVFEARCLTPMIEVRDTDVRGMTRIWHRAAWESWAPEDGAWELRRSLPGAVVQYCAIIGEFTWEESGSWAEAAIASGDYQEIDSEPLTLQSTFIREPRIEVEFDWMVPSVTVIETNLES